MSRKMLYNPFRVDHPLCFEVTNKEEADGYAVVDGDWFYGLVLSLYEAAKSTKERETRKSICAALEGFIVDCYFGQRVKDVLLCDQLDWVLRMSGSSAAKLWREEHPLAYKKFLKDTNTKEL